MAKQIIRLTENELKNYLTETLKRAINEWDEYDYQDFNKEHTNPDVEKLIQTTLSKLSYKVLHADAYVIPIIRGAIKRAYDLGCGEE